MTEAATDFQQWTVSVMGRGFVAHPWQESLGEDGNCDDRLIRIPTGFGKTLGILLAWSYHRLHRRDNRWPRRLVWCLPMRVLVEQTEAEVTGLLEKMGCLWSGTGPHGGRVGVHRLMGGVGAGEYHLWPEECAVLIGTQDMLLSRALNRGYAAAVVLLAQHVARHCHSQSYRYLRVVFRLVSIGCKLRWAPNASRAADCYGYRTVPSASREIVYTHTQTLA